MADSIQLDRNQRAAVTTAPVAAAAAAVSATVEDASDPDDDNLDDLDDLLDDFAPAKVDSAVPPPQPVASKLDVQSVPQNSGISASAAAAKPGDESKDAVDPTVKFTNQLQDEMTKIFDDMEPTPEMKIEFEELMRTLAVGDEQSTETGTKADGTAKRTGPSGGISFQDQIRQTMERMQTSHDTTGTGQANDDADDFMATLMREMGQSEGGEEGLGNVLAGMMDQLTTKDILYEPMKELDTKFPEWLEKNRAKTEAADLERYDRQRSIVREIVGTFEKADYKDDSVEYRQFIVDKMQHMQAAGSPPADLVGDMDAAQDAMGELDNECPTQ